MRSFNYIIPAQKLDIILHFYIQSAPAGSISISGTWMLVAQLNLSGKQLAESQNDLLYRLIVDPIMGHQTEMPVRADLNAFFQQARP